MATNRTKKARRRNEFEWMWIGRDHFKPSGKPITDELLAKLFNRHPDQIAARRRANLDDRRSYDGNR